MNDHKTTMRHSLIKKLYSTIFKTNVEIPIAWQRELLDKFGGIMTIEQFRNNTLACKKDYKNIIPPLFPLMPRIEEITFECSNLITSSKYNNYKAKNLKF